MPENGRKVAVHDRTRGPTMTTYLDFVSEPGGNSSGSQALPDILPIISQPIITQSPEKIKIGCLGFINYSPRTVTLTLSPWIIDDEDRLGFAFLIFANV